MTTVIYETEKGIFEFDLTDTIECLNCYASEHEVNDAVDLLTYLTSSSNDLARIPEGRSEFFCYITLDLISQSKGSAYCKICQKTYQANQLQSITVGHGKTPFSVNLKKKGGIKKLFFKKQKLPGLYGGKGYACPEGHELISMITWKT